MFDTRALTSVNSEGKPRNFKPDKTLCSEFIPLLQNRDKFIVTVTWLPIAGY